MTIEPLNMADISLVEIKNETPHCIKHGAMNKLTKNESGGGYWRCVCAVSNQNENTCRAGCIEVRK